METEKEISMKAGVREVVVKGTANEPRIYPGKGFKPGQKVQITIHQSKAATKAIKCDALDIYKFISDKKSNIDELVKEWNTWFDYVYMDSFKKQASTLAQAATDMYIHLIKEELI